MFTALLPGSFNPPTLGHLKLIERASRLCKHLHVGIGHNIEKKERLIPIEETLELLRQETAGLANVTISSFTGLATTFAKEIRATAFIRGVRNSNDLIHEMQMAEINYQLSGIETLFLPSHSEFIEQSATLIRELAHFGAPLNKFLTKPIADAITRRKQ